MGSGEIDKPCFLLSRRVYTHGRQGFICVSVRALQRNRTNSTDIYWGRFMIEINLHGYGGPEVPHCHLQLEMQEACGVVQSESEGPRTRTTNVQGQEKMEVPAQWEWIFPSSAFLLCSGPRGLDEAYLHLGEQSLLSPLMQMLISSRNTLPDMPRNNFTALWTNLRTDKVTHKINHNSMLKSSCKRN